MEPFGGLPVLRAGYIVKPHLDPGRTFHLFREARHGDAALHMPHGRGGLADDFRIDVGQDGSRCEFQHKNALLHADMGSGNADARRGAHGVYEVGHQRLQLRVKTVTGADIGKAGMGVGKDRPDCQGMLRSFQIRQVAASACPSAVASRKLRWVRASRFVTRT